MENPHGVSVPAAVARYRANPNVLYVEPDYVVSSLVTTPSDPLWSSQWDMVRIAAPSAWDTQRDASDVVVAIIDTGIDFSHPDLQSNLWTNPSDGSHGFTCMNGVCVAGGSDDFGHGTHVAGTIGAVANNGIGMAGINWGVKLLSLKFLDSNGSGYISDAVLCFQEVTALRQQGVNVRLTSNSWGGGGFSQALKDAMAQAEDAGVLHVCAAGNSSQNADASPMYPGAYDNRGIVSVLASDQNDAGASFSNYGLASVDIAAPGVSTLSTVPAGTCTLCDPSGYKFLSGTSMATPHVSGVLAALFHQNAALSTNEARDVVLDPGSYDALSDPKAQNTSTGGRLNFARALANPLLFAPRLNNFPVLDAGTNVFASPGDQVNLTPTASDVDNDPLRMALSRPSSYAGGAWLFGYMADTLFPNPVGSSVSFTAPSLARTATVAYDASVADDRGGSASGRDYVTVSAASNPGLPPSGTLTVSPTSAPAGSAITVTFPVSDPDGGSTAWDLRVGQTGSVSGWCCFTGSSATVTLNNAGVYRFSTQAIDSTLNVSGRQSAVVRIGGATGQPPIASAALDTQSGPVPLTVNVDMSASSDPDGTVQWWYVDCGGGDWTPGSGGSKWGCVFNTPGVYWIDCLAQDNSGNVDAVSAYVVATPSQSGGDTTPPTVVVTNPPTGATVSAAVTVTASASDNVGVARVDFYRDGGVLLGSSSSAPYAVTWNTAGVSIGSHSLYAKAVDSAGNTGTSVSETVTVASSDTTPPTVAITSPTDGATVSRRSRVTLTASASDDVGVTRVEFYVNGSLSATDTASPYSWTWRVPNRNGATYTLRAKAYDAAGNVGASTIITVYAR